MEERNQIEIAEGMTSEEIRAMFFDLKGLKWILENVPKREHEKLF